MDHTPTKQIIQRKLQQALAPISLEVIDESHKHVGHAGVKERGGGHFKVKIISHKFTGQTRIQSHQMVKNILKEEFTTNLIHALSIRIGQS